MQVSIQKNNPTEMTLAITAEEEELRPIKEQVLARIARNIKVPGFRTGKVPPSVAEKNVEPGILQSDFLDEAMTQLYAKATSQNNIKVVGRPEVSIKKFIPFNVLEFDVKATIIGDVSLPDYRKFKVSSKSITVSEEDINKVIESLRQRLSKSKEVKRIAKSHDEVVIDFVGYDKSHNPIKGAEGNDYPLILGSNSFIPGFEEKLIGAKKGDKVNFEITFPRDYGVTELAGQKTVFEVNIKKVSKLELPKLDDKFAAEVGPFKNIDELKEDIRKQLYAERKSEESARQQELLISELAEKTQAEIPQELVNQQLDHNIEEIRRNLTQRGQTWQEYLKSLNKTENDFRKDNEPNARNQIKTSLALSEIAEKEQLTIQPEELDLRIKLLKGQYKDNSMHTELDKPENRREIASRMLTEKVINFLISSAS